jgi:hypothetical protein
VSVNNGIVYGEEIGFTHTGGGWGRDNRNLFMKIFLTYIFPSNYEKLTHWRG